MDLLPIASETMMIRFTGDREVLPDGMMAETVAVSPWRLGDKVGPKQVTGWNVRWIYDPEQVDRMDEEARAEEFLRWMVREARWYRVGQHVHDLLDGEALVANRRRRWMLECVQVMGLPLS